MIIGVKGIVNLTPINFEKAATKVRLSLKNGIHDQTLAAGRRVRATA
jgi:hypothetical protein